MYDLGKGVPQDRSRAVELYLKGAEKGSLNAMLNVGISYWQGAGTAVDRVEAFKWRVRSGLEELQKDMSKAEIREGQQRSKEWHESHRPQ
jgi:hypothetical protein